MTAWYVTCPRTLRFVEWGTSTDSNVSEPGPTISAATAAGTSLTNLSRVAGAARNGSGPNSDTSNRALGLRRHLRR
jgi:hypothetical protein